MRKCLKIRVCGSVHSSSYKSLVQRHAQALSIEGSIQNDDAENVLIYACGLVDSLDKFIDVLYKGTTDSRVDDLIAEPFLSERNFRGAFRIIGE